MLSVERAQCGKGYMSGEGTRGMYLIWLLEDTLIKMFQFLDGEVGGRHRRKNMTATIGLVVHAAGKCRY